MHTEASSDHRLRRCGVGQFSELCEVVRRPAAERTGLNFPLREVGMLMYSAPELWKAEQPCAASFLLAVAWNGPSGSPAHRVGRSSCDDPNRWFACLLGQLLSKG
jgi:hypothetical protein